MQDAMDRLRQLRVGLGLTQEDVADAIGVRGKQVSLWENGKNELPASSLAVYIRLVKASADEVIGLIMKDQPDPEERLARLMQTAGGRRRIKRAGRRLLDNT